MNPEDIVKLVVYLSIFVGLFTLFFYLLTYGERRKKDLTIKRYPFVSIIIPAYNEEDALEKTVESTLKLNYPHDKYEIIIIDDGSKDNTLEIARKLAKNHKIIRVYTKSNGGKATALNFGIPKAKGEIVVSFDSDSMVTKESLIKMIPYFNDERVMCVTPVMKVYKPHGLLQKMQSIEYDLGIFLRKAFTNIDAVHVTPGPFSAYRKSFFIEHGGYDEKNITEDMEIAMRIQSLNYKIENSLDSVVYTIAPNKLRPLTVQRRRWYFGMIHNLWKYRRMFNKEYGELGTIILPLAIFSVFTVMAVTFFYIIKGIFDMITDLYHYSTIGFDFVNNFQIKWYLFTADLYRNFSESIILFSIFFFFTTILILILTNKRISSNEKPLSTFINYICFILLYSILFSIWWLISIFYALTKKEVKW